MPWPLHEEWELLSEHLMCRLHIQGAVLHELLLRPTDNNVHWIPSFGTAGIQHVQICMCTLTWKFSRTSVMVPLTNISRASFFRGSPPTYRAWTSARLLILLISTQSQEPIYMNKAETSILTILSCVQRIWLYYCVIKGTNYKPLAPQSVCPFSSYVPWLPAGLCACHTCWPSRESAENQWVQRWPCGGSWCPRTGRWSPKLGKILCCKHFTWIWKWAGVKDTSNLHNVGQVVSRIAEELPGLTKIRLTFNRYCSLMRARS